MARSVENAKDWRIGLTVRTIDCTSPHYYECGEIVNVLPDGSRDIADAGGVLVLKMSGGSVILSPASQWVLAE